MAVAEESQDFYAILGVETDVEADQLKKVYRKLLLKHHPDKNKDDPNAADKFKAITTAYDVISDPVKRAQYDSRATNSDDILLNISLKEAATGVTRLAHVGKEVRCDKCKGIGAICPSCPKCEGTRVSKAGGPCGTCDGRGFLAAEICTKCKGNTKVEEFDTSRVEVQPGVKHGFRIEIPNKSRQVRINILPSKIFKRSGDDIRATLELSVSEAKEGGPFEVDTLYGKDAVFLEEGLTTGREIRLEGQGMPITGKGSGDKKKGDHIIIIEVKGAKQQDVHSSWDTPQEETQPAAPGKRAAEGAAGAEGEAKKAKPNEEDELAKLLAEKKKALLASLGL